MVGPDAHRTDVPDIAPFQEGLVHFGFGTDDEDVGIPDSLACHLRGIEGDDVPEAREDLDDLGGVLVDDNGWLTAHTPEYAENPPSMGTTTPVTNAEAGERSQRNAPTRSSGSPK